MEEAPTEEEEEEERRTVCESFPILSLRRRLRKAEEREKRTTTAKKGLRLGGKSKKGVILEISPTLLRITAYWYTVQSTELKSVWLCLII